MVYFARCPACGAVNDDTSHHCYLCNASPLLVACSECGAKVRNPVLTSCPACGAPYRSQRSRSPADRESTNQSNARDQA